MAAEISLGPVGGRRCAWGGCPNEQTIDMTLKRCSACRAALYCGRNCQRGDWANHKVACLSNKREAPGELQLSHLLEAILALREASKAPFQVILPLIETMHLLAKGYPDGKTFSDLMVKQALECAEDGNRLNAELDLLEKRVKDQLDGLVSSEIKMR